MDRRKFLQTIGLGSAAIVAPKVALSEARPQFGPAPTLPVDVEALVSDGPPITIEVGPRLVGGPVVCPVVEQSLHILGNVVKANVMVMLPYGHKTIYVEGEPIMRWLYAAVDGQEVIVDEWQFQISHPITGEPSTLALNGLRLERWGNKIPVITADV